MRQRPTHPWPKPTARGLHYLLSAAVAFLLGVTTNYLLSISWVFASRTLSSRKAEATIFVLIGIAGLGLNELIMWIGTDLMLLHYLASKLISTALVFFFNFFCRQVFLFSGRREAAGLASCYVEKELRSFINPPRAPVRRPAPPPGLAGAHPVLACTVLGAPAIHGRRC